MGFIYWSSEFLRKLNNRNVSTFQQEDWLFYQYPIYICYWKLKCNNLTNNKVTNQKGNTNVKIAGINLQRFKYNNFIANHSTKAFFVNVVSKWRSSSFKLINEKEGWALTWLRYLTFLHYGELPVFSSAKQQTLAPAGDNPQQDQIRSNQI